MSSRDPHLPGRRRLPTATLSIGAIVAVVALFVFAAFMSSCSRAPRGTDGRTTVERLGKLQVQGVQLSSADGRPVQLRAPSLFWINWEEHNVKRSAIDYMVREMGADIIRIPVPAFDYAKNGAMYDAQMAMIVGWAKSNGVYALIDWHVVDDPNKYSYTGPRDADDDRNDMALKFWRRTAKKFANDPYVLYEICNEPTGAGWAEIKEYAKKVIAEIRKHDTSTVIIVGTPEWSRRTIEAAKDPLTVDAAGDPVKNIMYTYHGYASTHGMKADIDTIVHKIPIFATEWGVSEASGTGRIDWERSREFVDFLRNNPHQKISWCQWSWTDKRESSALLAPGTGGVSWQLSPAGDSCKAWAIESPDLVFPEQAAIAAPVAGTPAEAAPEAIPAP